MRYGNRKCNVSKMLFILFIQQGEHSAMTKPNGHHKEESAIQFPCDFTLKIMGKTEGDFEAIATDIVKKHFPKTSSNHIQKKLSKDKNYLSLSVTVHAITKAELDALYQELSTTQGILMVL